MPVTINGTTGVSLVQDGVVTQADLASGVTGNGPAFSAYAVGSNSMTAATLTKITFDTELFDTNNNFSSSRFTPTVAGYYRISAQVTGQNTCTGICYASIYVNGAQYKTGTYVQYSGSGTKFGVEGLVYCNGSTDYVEIYGFVPSTMGTYTAASYFTWFDGAMVRSA